MAKLTLIQGDIGSGKTLIMVYFILLSEYRKIYSNFMIKNSTVNVEKFRIKYILDERINNSDLYLDEMYMLTEARRFNNDLNLLISYLCFQARKLNLRLFGSTQLYRSIDIRVREMFDSVIECKVHNNIYTNKPEYFEYNIFTKIDNFYEPHTIYFDAHKCDILFNSYDTTEIITSPQFDELKRNLSMYEYTEQDYLDIALQSRIYLKEQKIKYNKTGIGIFLRNNNYSTKKKMVDIIYSKGMETIK